jgi:hypothetical protein
VSAIERHVGRDGRPAATTEPLGVLLRAHGVLDESEVDRALADQERSGGQLGQILLEQGLISRPLLDRVLAQQAGIVLEAEAGFGTGLRGLIERRHLERSGVRVPSFDPDFRIDEALDERRLDDRRAQGDRRRQRRRSRDARAVP